MGSTKTYERIVAQSIYDKVMKTVSHRMVYNTFKENNLLKYTKPLNPSPIQRCRYEADYVDLIWHTDLHNFNDQYLIAFIDDYSRFIVHYELIPNKYAAITSGVLERALANNNRPFSIWTDNGGEFKAEFLGTLEKNNIKQVLSDHYTPQQNGKCERFWSTADLCSTFEQLNNWIQVYNTIPHMGLPKIIVEGRIILHLLRDITLTRNGIQAYNLHGQ